MTSEKNFLKKWLDKLQEESWNLELLISGFSIFGLFKAREFLADKAALLSANDIETDSLMAFFSFFYQMISVSVLIFIFFLLLHIFFRGLWIGAIGLRYVSGEIDYDKFKYNSRITDFLKKKIGTFDDYILKLEKLSSIIFGYTFLIILVLFSVYLYLIFTALANIYSSKLFSDTAFDFIPNNVVPLLTLLLGIFAIFDFITAGLLKKIRNKFLNKVYIICNKIVTWITLAFLWKPLYYNLIDKKRTKWLIYVMIPFVALIYLQTTVSYNSFLIFPKNFNSDGYRKFNSISLKEKARVSFQTQFYDNLRQKNEVIQVISLQNHKINSKSIELFVKLNNHDENLIIKMDSTIKPVTVKGFSSYLLRKSEYESDLLKRRESDFKYSFFKNEQKIFRENLDKILQSAKNLYSVRINEVPVNKDSIDVLFHKHLNQNEEGFLFLFPANLENGMNLITLEKKELNWETKEYETIDFTIPFIYSKP